MVLITNHDHYLTLFAGGCVSEQKNVPDDKCRALQSLSLCAESCNDKEGGMM